ncbi:hypothetical protein S245_016798, partial [Arachis hypogaea]
ASSTAIISSRFRFPSSLASISRSTLSSPLSPLFRSSFNFSSSRSSRHHIVVKATDDSSNLSGDDPFRSFPWFQSDSEIQWVHEDRITLFTADGLVQIGGSITPRHVSSSDDAAQVMAQLVWEGLGLGGGTDVRNWGSLVYQVISIANNACWAIGELAVKMNITRFLSTRNSQ